MADINIRQVDPELKKQVKAAAALAGKKMREWVLEQLQKGLKKRGQA